MDSIIQNGRYCYLCGKSIEPLDRHHVFGGANRKKSEKYGLTVYLCHDSCHIFGYGAVHMNAEVDRKLKQEVQRKAMAYYGWNFDDWRKEFGKSYL